MFIFSGGFISASCNHGVTYCFKPLLRQESVRDHVDLIKSFNHQPTVVINDMAGFTAKHGNKRFPKMFHPNEGRLCNATDEVLSSVKAGKFEISLPSLARSGFNCPSSLCHQDHAYSVPVHPVTQMEEHFILSDEFHKRNSSNKLDQLRDPSLVPEIRTAINTQAQEQLYSQVKKDVYFLDCMEPGRHIFTLRLILHLRNQAINMKLLSALGKRKVDGTRIAYTKDKRVTLQPMPSTVSNPDVHEPEETVPNTVSNMDLDETEGNVKKCAKSPEGDDSCITQASDMHEYELAQPSVLGAKCSFSKGNIH